MTTGTHLDGVYFIPLFLSTSECLHTADTETLSLAQQQHTLLALVTRATTDRPLKLPPIIYHCSSSLEIVVTIGR